MTIIECAVCLIALCEVIRAVQNLIQLAMLKHDARGRDNAYSEFVKSLKVTDREFVRMMLEKFEEQEGEQDE